MINSGNLQFAMPEWSGHQQISNNTSYFENFSSIFSRIISKGAQAQSIAVEK